MIKHQDCCLRGCSDYDFKNKRPEKTSFVRILGLERLKIGYNAAMRWIFLELGTYDEG
jgi:hypothetical protein